jgi:hypothetical protein
MGQMPGPSYPFGWPDTPQSPDKPPGPPSWGRWFALAILALGLLLLAGVALSAFSSAFP